MLWTEDPTHAFAGIVEKLKRSYESIVNLSAEMDTFFKASKYPIMPDVNSKEWQEALDYHRGVQLPKRFSVLSGEIIHHLRSSLDHIAWHFSSTQYRTEAGTSIEFPVFREEPLAKDKLRQYERKVKGIANPKVLTLIRDMQPYNRGSDAENDLLCVVHDMDRFDKHRELAIVGSCAKVLISPTAGIEAALAVLKYSQGEPLSNAELSLVNRTVKQDAKVLPQVEFPQVGKRKGQPVIPTLLQLHEVIFQRVDLFEDLV